MFDDCWRAVQGMDAIQHGGLFGRWDHPRLREQAAAQGVPFDATFQSNMLGTYYLMQAAVAAGVERVVMAGSNCALGHGYRISQTPFPFQARPLTKAIRRFRKIPTVIPSWRAKCCWPAIRGPMASVPTSPDRRQSAHRHGVRKCNATRRAGDRLESLAVGLGGKRGCGPCTPAPDGGTDAPATTRCVLCHG